MIGQLTVSTFVRRHRNLVACSALGLLFACGTDPELGDGTFGLTGEPQPAQVGLYTPGHVQKINASNADAGYSARDMSDWLLQDVNPDTCKAPAPDIGMTATEAATAKASNQDLSLRVHTPASMTLTFITKQPGGKWKPGNVGAVWVEDVQGRPVRRLQVWAAERVTCLAFYLSKTCRNFPDVVSTATLPDHTMPHNVSWDGKDFLGALVPDGQYTVTIEVADVERTYGLRATIPFVKGAQPAAMNIPDTQATTGLQLNYTPSLGAASGPTKP